MSVDEYYWTVLFWGSSEDVFSAILCGSSDADFLQQNTSLRVLVYAWIVFGVPFCTGGMRLLEEFPSNLASTAIVWRALRRKS